MFGHFFFFSFFKDIRFKKKTDNLFLNSDFIFLLSAKNSFQKSIFGYSNFENILLKRTFQNFFHY